MSIVYEPPPVHECTPATRVVTITPAEREASRAAIGISPPFKKYLVDDSNRYAIGTVWECPNCGRRWTRAAIPPYEHGRLMATWRDWIPESTRRWQRRLRQQRRT